MPENFLGDLIVFGAIALFIVLRYRSMLGQKKGHDFSKSKPDSKDARVISLHTQKELPKSEEPKKDEALEAMENEDVAKSLAQMKAVDAQFTADSFIQGAKSAYEMVIEAFSKHDKDTLKMLLAKELYKDFEQDIEDQKSENRHAQTTLVSVTDAKIVGADLIKNMATIIVEFSSEQINVVKNDKEDIVEGDASQIQDMKDEWVFERDMKSRNPNWTIIDT